MPAHVLARHVPVEEAPFHCVLCAVKVDDFATMKAHISSARHRARLSMADDEAAATSLGRGLWVYHDEGLGADATALPIGESSRYWRLHQQASRMEVAEVSEEDLPIRPARTPATPVSGEEYVVLCEDAPWELPELLQFPSPLPEDISEAQHVPSTVALPASEVSAPTSSIEQVPQSTAVPVPALEVTVSDEQGEAAASSDKPVAAAEDQLEPVTVDIKQGLATLEPAPVAPGPSEAERVIALTKSLFTPVLQELRAQLIEPLVNELAAVRHGRPDAVQGGHKEEDKKRDHGRKDQGKTKKEGSSDRRSHGDGPRERSASRHTNSHRDSPRGHAASRQDRRAPEAARGNRQESGRQDRPAEEGASASKKPRKG